jgi:hypothetical protein
MRPAVRNVLGALVEVLATGRRAVVVNSAWSLAFHKQQSLAVLLLSLVAVGFATAG